MFSDAATRSRLLLFNDVFFFFDILVLFLFLFMYILLYLFFGYIFHEPVKKQNKKANKRRHHQKQVNKFCKTC